jgi:Zn-dependent protease with chaperone function
MSPGPSDISWLAWIARLFTVVLAILLSLLGTELVRMNAQRRLDGLRSRHWTEQARVFTETNKVTRLFRLYLITMTTTLMLYAEPELSPPQVLRFGAVVALLVLVVGDPLAGRWVRRATAGSLTPSSWLEAKGFGLMMFPSFWLLSAFGLMAPVRYDWRGWVWASALLLALAVAQAGGVALLCRALGIVRPATHELRELVASIARAAGVPEPPVYELKSARVNAMALPTLGWMVFTSAAVEQLEPGAISVVAAHELGHLRESLLIKLVRVASGAALFLAVGFVPAFPQQPMIGLAYGCGLFALVALGLRVLSVRLERRADAVAHEHEQQAGDYAAALERIYQLNWMGAGVVNRTHPSLYDRMEKAGVKPTYARPAPPARSPTWLALAFGLVGALTLAFIVNPLLVALLESLTQR